MFDIFGKNSNFKKEKLYIYANTFHSNCTLPYRVLNVTFTTLYKAEYMICGIGTFYVIHTDKICCK